VILVLFNEKKIIGIYIKFYIVYKTGQAIYPQNIYLAGEIKFVNCSEIVVCDCNPLFIEGFILHRGILKFL